MPKYVTLEWDEYQQLTECREEKRREREANNFGIWRTYLASPFHNDYRLIVKGLTEEQAKAIMKEIIEDNNKQNAFYKISGYSVIDF